MSSHVLDPVVSKEVEAFMAGVVVKSPGEAEFHQAVREVAQSVMPVVLATPAYRQHNVLERLTVPDRAILFRVTWVDDKGQVQVNRGYRVQM